MKERPRSRSCLQFVNSTKNPTELHIGIMKQITIKNRVHRDSLEVEEHVNHGHYIKVKTKRYVKHVFWEVDRILMRYDFRALPPGVPDRNWNRKR